MPKKTWINSRGNCITTQVLKKEVIAVAYQTQGEILLTVYTPQFINMAGWPDLEELFTEVLLVRNKSTVRQLGLPNSVIQKNQHISGYSHLFLVVHLFDIIYNNL